MKLEENATEEELICNYFKQGYNNQEILDFLTLHGIFMSLSTLKQRMRALKLVRREANMEHNVSPDDLKKVIEKEMAGSGCLIGYRKMWAPLRKRNIFDERQCFLLDFWFLF